MRRGGGGVFARLWARFARRAPQPMTSMEWTERAIITPVPYFTFAAHETSIVPLLDARMNDAGAQMSAFLTRDLWRQPWYRRVRDWLLALPCRIGLHVIVTDEVDEYDWDDEPTGTRLIRSRCERCLYLVHEQLISQPKAAP